MLVLNMPKIEHNEVSVCTSNACEPNAQVPGRFFYCLHYMMSVTVVISGTLLGL